jgi:hypothetical protein
MTEEEIAVKFTALGRRYHRQGAMQKVAELHHEHGNRQGPWRAF